TKFNEYISGYRSLLSSEASGGSLVPVQKQAAQLIQFAFAVSPSPVSVNDNDQAVQYSGAWGYYPGRPASFKDLQNDVHATLNNGDAATFSFKGTGIAYVS